MVLLRLVGRFFQLRVVAREAEIVLGLTEVPAVAVAQVPMSAAREQLVKEMTEGKEARMLRTHGRGRFFIMAAVLEEEAKMLPVRLVGTLFLAGLVLVETAVTVYQMITAVPPLPMQAVVVGRLDGLPIQ
jgi:hypothetical protein